MKTSALLVITVVLLLIFHKAAGNHKKMVVRQPLFIKATVGESVTISCFFETESPSFTVKWILCCDRQKSLLEHQTYKHRVTISSTFKEITLGNVTEQDSEKYCCEVMTADGEMGVGNGTVLDVAPYIEKEVNGQKHLVVTQPEIMKAESGESVTITCSFTSNITIFSVTWTLGCNSSENLQDLPCFQRRVKISSPEAGQTPHSPQGAPKYKVNTTITIITLTESDSGTFCCHVKAPGMEGTGPGTRLEVTPRSILKTRPEESFHKVHFLVEILHVTCLIILIILLGIAVKKSC